MCAEERARKRNQSTRETLVPSRRSQDRPKIVDTLQKSQQCFSYESILIFEFKR